MVHIQCVEIKITVVACYWRRLRCWLRRRRRCRREGTLEPLASRAVGSARDGGAHVDPVVLAARVEVLARVLRRRHLVAEEIVSRLGIDETRHPGLARDSLPSLRHRWCGWR